MPPVGFLNPNSVLEEWDIRPNGKLYSFHPRPEALEATRGKAKLFHLFNIEPTRADLEVPRGSGLKDWGVDKILISNILFQVEDQNAVIAEASRILRPGGSLLVIEWNENDAAHPIPSSKVNKEEIKSAFSGVGFGFQKEFAAGSHHYGLLFTKKD